MHGDGETNAQQSSISGWHLPGSRSRGWFRTCGGEDAKQNTEGERRCRMGEETIHKQLVSLPVAALNFHPKSHYNSAHTKCGLLKRGRVLLQHRPLRISVDRAVVMCCNRYLANTLCAAAEYVASQHKPRTHCATAQSAHSLHHRTHCTTACNPICARKLYAYMLRWKNLKRNSSFHSASALEPGTVHLAEWFEITTILSKEDETIALMKNQVVLKYRYLFLHNEP